MLSIDSLVFLLEMTVWFLAGIGLMTICQDGLRWLSRTIASEIIWYQTRAARDASANQKA